MENHIETALTASKEELLTVIEFIEVTEFPIDAFMIDRFWNTMEEDRLIYVDDELIRWMGYRCASVTDRKRDFVDMLHPYMCGDDYYNYTTKEYNNFLAREDSHSKNIYPPAPTARGSVTMKHLLLTPDCLRAVMMRVNTARGNEVRQYYISLEKLFKTYIKYQMEFKNIETNRLLKETRKELAQRDVYINNVKSLIENVHYLIAKEYVYIATTYMYASKNQFKIGKAQDLRSRLSSYNTGRPEGDRYFYVNVWATCDCFLLEKKITTPIKQWRDAKDREMYVINYDWLYQYVKEVCEHDNVEMGMVNDLIKNYSAIVGRKPPKVTPLLKYPKKNAIVPIDPETKEEIQFTFSIKGWTPDKTKKFISKVLEEYKEENEITSWTRLQKFLTSKLKEHDKKPNVKVAKDQIMMICDNVGIEIS